MNWTNYGKLTSYLRRINPSLFNYGSDIVRGDSKDGCGCVAVCVADLSAATPSVFNGKRYYQARHIAEFLDISLDDARYIYGFDARNSAWSIVEEERKGEIGIGHALRRLDVVAQRYGGETAPAPAPVSSPIPTEAQWLADLTRSLAVPARQEPAK